MSYKPCGRTVDGVFLVHGQVVSEDEFMAWRADHDAPLRCAPGTLASEPAQATDVQAREYAY